MATKRQRSHYVTIRVAFSKPVTAGAAIKAVRDEFKNMEGETLVFQGDDADWIGMKITGVANAARTRHPEDQQ